VALAESDRRNRTQNSEQRLRGSGTINKPGIALRTCLEIKREKQLCGTSKVVPYRDSKITTLFRNCFDGDGQVRMIVYVNPGVDNETVHMMKFAEITEEIEMSQPVVTKLDYGFIPDRRKVNQILKPALQKTEENDHRNVQNIDADIGLDYCLETQFPSLELDDQGND
jgi:kinesin family protein 23